MKLGKGSLSYKKQEVLGDRTIGVGFKKLVFAHKATADGTTDIDLTALNAPTELTSIGFVNPTSAELATANLLFYKENLRLVSSLNRELLPYLSYDVISSTKIRLKNGAEMTNGEIFIGYIDSSPADNLAVVDGTAIVSTGDLAVSATDYTVGQPFQVNKYSSTQIGDVLVYRNGVLQMRNVGNSPSGQGNYYEVPPSAGGLSNTIRFNVAPTSVAEAIVVVSNGLMVERPTSAILARYESLAGQMDRVVQDLALVTGNPTSNYQAAPNSVDLAVFGNMVRAMISGIHYDAVVGSATQLSNGWATHTSVQTAINDVASGGSILVLQGTYTENLSINKTVSIFGKGNGSFISGTVTFGSSALNALVKYMRASGNISAVSGSRGVIMTECWKATAATVSDAGTDNNFMLVDY